MRESINISSSSFSLYPILFEIFIQHNVVMINTHIKSNEFTSVDNKYFNLQNAYETLMITHIKMLN